MTNVKLQKALSQVDWQTFYKHLKTTNKLNDPKSIRELVYFRAYQDFEYFVQTFFPHHCAYPFSTMHKDFITDEADPTRRRRRDVIAAPRGHAKTTFKVLFKVMHAIVYAYEPFVVIIGHSAPEAEQKLQDILHELEHNEKLIQIYGALAPQKGPRKKGFTTRNGTRVIAKSRGQQLRGLKYRSYRPSLIILDDIESPEEVLSEDQRRKTLDWFQKDVMKMGPVDGTHNVTIIGTCLHPESLLVGLLGAPGWRSRRYQAVLSFSKREDLWARWKEIYTNLDDENREAHAWSFFEENRAAMLEGTEVLWPDGEPYERLMKMQVDEGIASFQSEKQNDPYDPTRQLFDMELAKRFRVVELDGQPAIEWLDGSGKIVYGYQLERIVAFHDPALCEKDGDYAAIVVVAKDKSGYFYCLYAYIDKQKPSQQVEHAFYIQKEYPFDTLYLETNNFQRMLRNTYTDYQMKHGEDSFRVIGINQAQNKQKRIATLEPLITNGRLLFAENLNQRLISQMRLFPTSADDGPDALHGAVEELRKGVGTITVLDQGSYGGF